MIDKYFQDFVRDNIAMLDELARRYGEYRIEVIKSYVDELGARIRERTPAGYGYVKEFKFVPDEDQKVGWSREVEIGGSKALVTICFGMHIDPTALAGAWPLMNGSCFTGVQAWLPANIREAALASARELALETEPRDEGWLLWRFWEPLSATTVEGFHGRILGDDRVAGQNEIVEQLIQWKIDFERVIQQTNKARG